MGELKLDPPLAKIILESIRHRCVDEVLSIARVPGVEEVCSREFDRSSNVCHSGCDFLTPLKIFNESLKQKEQKRVVQQHMKLNIRALEKAVEIKKATIEQEGS